MIMKQAMTAAMAVLVALGSAGPAAAARPKTALDVSYEADAGYAVAVTLRCGPAGGGHPKAAKACAALTRAGGRPARLKPARILCTLEYSPVTARIEGTWKGRKVRWAKTYGNRCDLARATGVVFDF